jgi:DNA modification methylase
MALRTANVVADDGHILAALDQIAGTKRLGQQREPHWFHPFPARLSLAVASHVISSCTTPSAVVADPMVGSGTTLIAARRLGRSCIGVDRDHLAVRIARCASHSFVSGALEELQETLINRARKIIGRRTFRLGEIRAELPQDDQEFIRYWFPPNSQRQLFALAEAIGELAPGTEQDFAWVVFSSLIIAKSAGASHALDISRSRPHKRVDKPVVAPFDAWSRRFRSAVSRLPFLDVTPPCRAEVRHGDARALSLESASIDCVLTSPPYRNAIDYLRCHKFSLVWMGHRISDLRELRGTMIGTERGLWSLDGLPASLEQRLERASAEPREVALMRQYLADMRKVMSEVARILRPQGLAVLVVGPTMINAKRSDAADVFIELASAAGLRFVGSIQRSLDVSRRSLPPPQYNRSGVHLAKRMRREVVFIVRKP